MKKGFILFCLLNSSLAFAQGGGMVGNGGDWSEADLKHFLSRLSPYLQSADGREAFPEILKYDETHSDETIEKIISELNPRLVNHSVFDSKENERDCVSYAKPVRYFECNLHSLPLKPDSNASYDRKSEYYGSLYRLALHEALVQVELEKPLTHEVPSEYAISSRLMVHLEDFPEWVPGAAKPGTAVRDDFTIHTTPDWYIKAGGGGGFNGRILTGVDLSAQLPVHFGPNQFKVGITTGYEYGFSTFGESSGWIIPILATGEFDFKPFHSIHPFIRLGLGISIVHANYYAYDFSSESIYPYTQTDVIGSIEFAPGFYFGNHEQFLFEVPFTARTGSTTIMAKFGVKF